MIKKLVTILASLTLIMTVAVVVSYKTVPVGNTTATHFDTLVILGCPPNPDGSPSSEERERVMTGVREFRSGRADHMIMTGGAAHSLQTEANVMASVALSEGVPPQAVLVETRAMNTIENMYFSHEMMEKHGWTTAEVVSSPSHLSRAALILEHYRFGWKVTASHWPSEYSWRRRTPYYVREALGTAMLRWFGFRASPYLPSNQSGSQLGLFGNRAVVWDAKRR